MLNVLYQGNGLKVIARITNPDGCALPQLPYLSFPTFLTVLCVHVYLDVCVWFYTVMCCCNTLLSHAVMLWSLEGGLSYCAMFAQVIVCTH